MEVAFTTAHDVFYWCLRSSGEASVLVAVILAMQAILRRRMPARWQYCLWLILVARMALPWAPESAVSVFNYMPKVEPAAILSSSDSASVAPDETPQEPSGEPGTDDALAQSAHRETSEPLVTVDSPAHKPARRAVSLIDVLTLVWFLGAAALGGNILIENFWFWSQLHDAERVSDPVLRKLLEDCKRLLGVRSPVELAITNAVPSPALFGFLRPRLLLPPELLDRLGVDEMRFVFLHELAHVKRHDIFINWVVAVLQALHWFNPVIWFAFHRMRLDRELACDALTMSRLGQGESTAYGHTMVNLLERAYRVRRIPGMAGILEDHTQIKRRITLIARFKPNALRWSVLALAALGVVGAIGLTDRVGAPALSGPQTPPEVERSAPTASYVLPATAATVNNADPAPAYSPQQLGALTFKDVENLGPVFQDLYGLSSTQTIPTDAGEITAEEYGLRNRNLVPYSGRDRFPGGVVVLRAKGKQAVLAVNADGAGSRSYIAGNAPEPVLCVSAQSNLSRMPGVGYHVVSLHKDHFLKYLGDVPAVSASTSHAALDLSRTERLIETWNALNPRLGRNWLSAPSTSVFYRVEGGRLEADKDRCEAYWKSESQKAADQIKTLRAGVAKSPNAEIQPAIEDRGLGLLRAIITRYLNERMLSGSGKGLAAFRADLHSLDDEYFYYSIGRNGRDVTCRYPIAKIEPIVLAAHDSIPDPYSVDPGSAERTPPTCALRVTTPAYTLSPIWVTAEFGHDAESAVLQAELRYPFTAFPQDLGPYQLELRRDGEPVEPLDTKRAQYMIAHVGGPPTSSAPSSAPAGRLPLHLRYRIDKPGRYEVRLTVRSEFYSLAPAGEIVYQSDWTAFDVSESDYAARQARLDKLRKTLPNDSGLLVGDYLPSLLAAPDATTFDALLPYLNHADSKIQEYATRSLALFDDDTLRDCAIHYLSEKGASSWLGDLAQRRPEIYAPRAAHFAEVLVNRLSSDEPATYAAALKILSAARHTPSGATPILRQELAAKCDEVVRDLIDRIEANNNAEALVCLARYASVAKFEGAQELLWRLAKNPAVNAEALASIASLAQPDDLPKLGAFLCVDSKGLVDLPLSLERAYGAKAAPYLRKALSETANPALRVECARVLAKYDDQTALEFFKNAIAKEGPQSTLALDRLTDLLAPEITKVPEPGKPSYFIREPGERKRKVLELLDHKLDRLAKKSDQPDPNAASPATAQTQAATATSLTVQQATTLNANLQAKAESLLVDKTGAICVLNADTGEVLALATRSLDTSNPNLNLCYQAAYSPGSLFKVVLASAALQEGVVTESTAINCSGSFNLAGGRSWNCWLHSGHGGVTAVQALTTSCDVFFYNAAQSLGVDKIERYAALMGLGQKTGLDARDEEAGLVPSPEWKKTLAVRLNPKPDAQDWYPGDTLNLAIGQGAFRVTPLQCAVMMSVVVNGGHRVRPYTVKGATPDVSEALFDDRTIELVRKGMRQCVEADVPPGGSGKAARIPGLVVLGKTGSAQVIGNEQLKKKYVNNEDRPYELRDHAWFIAGVLDQPVRIAVCIFIEHGMRGVTAAPLAKEVLAEFYHVNPTEGAPSKTPTQDKDTLADAAANDRDATSAPAS